MVKSKIYDSGLTLVVEQVSGKSIAFTQMVRVGSQDEQVDEYGLAHFTEHFMFKSTDSRTTAEINEELEFLGCDVNASTTKERTMYFFKSIYENFEKALEIFSDMLQNGIYREDEIDAERGVVVQEINMYADDSDDIVYESTSETFFKGTKFAHPILGTIDIIQNTPVSKLKSFKEKHYIPQNIVISIVGDISFEQAEMHIQKYFPKYFEGKALANQFDKNPLDINIENKYVIVDKDDTQVRLRITIKGVNSYDADYFTQFIYGIILGGGVTSRLYQRIREELGLAYAIYAMGGATSHIGKIDFFVGTTNDNLRVVIQEICSILTDMATNGVTQRELDKARNMVKSSFIFREENIASKSTKNAQDMLVWGYSYDVDEYLKSIDQVTVQDINNFAKRIYNEQDYVVCVVGKDINIEDLKLFGMKN